MRTLKTLLIPAFVILSLTTHVYAAEKAINTARIKAEITRTILENSPWDKKDLEVDSIAINGSAEFEKADGFKVEAPSGMKNLGKISLSVKLFSGGREIKTLWATARVRAYKDAVVAMDSLRVNSRISAEDVKLERVDVNEGQDSYGSVEDVVGMTVKRPVSPGSVIRRDSVKPDALVKRGSRVVLMVQNKGFMVKSSGVAAEDGYPGDIIKARTRTGGEIIGKVTGREELTIEF